MGNGYIMDSSVILRTLSSAHAVGATAEERAAEVKLYEEVGSWGSCVEDKNISIALC